MMQHFISSYGTVDFRTINSLNPVKDIEKISRESFDIIIARGNTAVEVRKAMSNVHVVEFKISSCDILNVLRNNNVKPGQRIAVITVNLDVVGFELIADILGIELLDYRFTSRDKLEETIKTAVRARVDLIVGGSITQLAAQKIGIRTILLTLSVENIRETLEKAFDISHAITLEEVHQRFLAELMDNIQEGIVAIDDHDNVIKINRIAEKMLKVSRDRILNKSVKALPEIFWQDFEGEYDESIVTLHKHLIVVSKTKVIHDGVTFGRTFILYEKSNVERMEHSLKTALYAHEHKAKYTFDDIMTSSPGLRPVISQARKFARTSSNILITGESGTGKEVFAQSIHNASKRRNKPFVAINCAAVPKELLQSELFGYVEGAFTGALRQGKAGLFEIAEGGTVFLDEIAEMDYNTQATLLRVIQERYIIRVGSHHPVAISCSIISATNKKLLKLIDEGKFREDLYYRLNVLALQLPALRDHKEDIIPLLLYFLNKNGSKHKTQFSFSEEARALLESHPWNGNIRELQNFSERLVAVSTSPHVQTHEVRSILGYSTSTERSPIYDLKAIKTIRASEQIEQIRNALLECGGNISAAARKLGISRTTLWRRLKVDS